MEIRPFKQTDLGAVLQAWERATRLAHPFISDDFIARERHNITDLYLPNTDTWVVLANDEVKGFIALMGNEVGALFVLPDWHGQGLGHALMGKAQALHGELEVEVFKINQLGRRFYDKYGFKQISESIHQATNQTVLRLRFTPNEVK